MKSVIILILSCYIVGLMGACPKWESVDTGHHLHDNNIQKNVGKFYAHAIIPRPEHVNKRCIYFDVKKTHHNKFRVAFHTTDKITGQEEVLNGNFVLDHDSKEFKFVFDDPSIEQWDELYLTDINPHFGINYHCRGDEMHPYAYTRQRKPSQKVLDEMMAVLASRGVGRDQLTIVDQKDCKN